MRIPGSERLYLHEYNPSSLPLLCGFGVSGKSFFPIRIVRHMVAFHFPARVISSQHRKIMAFLGICISLLDRNREVPSFLKQHFLLVNKNLSNSYPQVGLICKERIFFSLLQIFCSCFYMCRSVFILD